MPTKAKVLGHHLGPFPQVYDAYYWTSESTKPGRSRCVIHALGLMYMYIKYKVLWTYISGKPQAEDPSLETKFGEAISSIVYSSNTN